MKIILKERRWGKTHELVKEALACLHSGGKPIIVVPTQARKRGIVGIARMQCNNDALAALLLHVVTLDELQRGCARGIGPRESVKVYFDDADDILRTLAAENTGGEAVAATLTLDEKE